MRGRVFETPALKFGEMMGFVVWLWHLYFQDVCHTVAFLELKFSRNHWVLFDKFLIKYLRFFSSHVGSHDGRRNPAADDDGDAGHGVHGWVREHGYVGHGCTTPTRSRPSANAIWPWTGSTSPARRPGWVSRGEHGWNGLFWVNGYDAGLRDASRSTPATPSMKRDWRVQEINHRCDGAMQWRLQRIVLGSGSS